MNDKNSCLVDYKLIDVGLKYIYGMNNKWADPCTLHASSLMRKIKSNSSFRNKISKQAAFDIKNFHSREIYEKFIQKRLSEIEGKRI